MIIKRPRMEDITLINHIQDRVLFQEFVETRIDDLLLETSAGSGIYQISVPDTAVPNPFQRGRGIFYDDEITVSGAGVIPDESKEQETRVVVKTAADVVKPFTEYTVDYISGKITNLSGTAPAKATYDWRYVSTLDSFPEVRESNRRLDLPFVVVHSEGQNRPDPLQLGGGVITKRNIELHIYANNSPERDDIVGQLVGQLQDRSIQLVDINNTSGFILNYDGTFNDSYSALALQNASKVHIEDITYRNIPGTRDYTFGERYKTVIKLNTRVYSGFNSL